MYRCTHKIISILLCIISLLSISLPIAGAKTDTANPAYSTDNSYADINNHRFYAPVGDLFASKSADDINEPTSAIKRDKSDIAAVGTDTQLPKSVDNSALKYFPPIGDQKGLGSCVTWACVYYQFTYEVNRALDTAATDNFIASPKFVYNFLNYGQNGGTEHSSAYRFLAMHGAPSIDLLPYDDNYLDWNTTEEIWKDASKYQLLDYYIFDDIGENDAQITSADDPDLNEIKSALASGNVLTFSTYAISWYYDNLKQSPDAPGNVGHENEYVCLYLDGQEGGHRVTIVGYDDNIWCDVNHNSKVDAGEMGAFKIANSFSEGYGNKGFAWVAYDALNKVSAVEGATINSKTPCMEQIASIRIKPQEESDNLYLKYTLNTADRTQQRVIVTASRNGTTYSHQMFWGAGYISTNNRYAFDGTKEACDGTFVITLDNIVPGITSASVDEYDWNIEVIDLEEDSVPIVLKSAEIVDEVKGKSYKANIPEPIIVNSAESKTVELNKSTLTDKVIYYIGYDSPTINYKKENGEWTSAKMKDTTDCRGYLYKYVINSSTEEEIILSFSDSNQNLDDNNGNFYTATDKLNYYRTNGVREPLTIVDWSIANGTPDLKKVSYFEVNATGGYGDYLYSYVFENLTTGDVTIMDYDDPSNGSYTFVREGNYKITISVNDYSNDTVSLTKEMYIKDIPFEFTSFVTTPAKHFTAKEITFKAITNYEGVFSFGNKSNEYTFTIKDSSNNVCYTETKKSDYSHFGDKTSIITLNWTPYISGNYTITVTSTDINQETAQSTIEFTVWDKIYGDADGNNEVNIKDATTIQKYVASVELTTDFYSEMADCDQNAITNIKDATLIQKFIASIESTGVTGSIIPCEPPKEETPDPEPEPEPDPTPTPEPEPEPERNFIMFTNSMHWSGQIYCYYWSSEKNLVNWPGTPMTYLGINDYAEGVFSIELPEEADFIIFTNGSNQTIDIGYPGGEIRYYTLSSTDSNGHNFVSTW